MLTKKKAGPHVESRLVVLLPLGLKGHVILGNTRQPAIRRSRRRRPSDIGRVVIDQDFLLGVLVGFAKRDPVHGVHVG